ncbi:MAG: hypothetical protein IJU81_02515 [Bacteroidales bacterium]|nr:hypothetical protein [Bacteroidales bacterium]
MDWTQIAIALVSGGALTGAAFRLLTLRAKRRQARAEARQAEMDTEDRALAVDDHRFDIYTKIIEDLNGRIANALQAMAELEEKVRTLERDNNLKDAEIQSLRLENNNLRQQLDLLLQ